MVLAWILFFLNIATLFAFLSNFDKRAYLSVASSVAIVFVEFMAITNVLLIFDAYNNALGLSLSLIINVLLLLGVFLKNKSSFVNNLKSVSFKIDVVFLVLIIFAVALSWNVNGFFGMGQDEGGYAAHGIARALDYPNLKFDFENEIKTIGDDSRMPLDEYKGRVRIDFGFYPSDYDFFTEQNLDNLYLSGVIHGLHSYPSLLGLSGKLFGLRNILFINHIIVLLEAVFLSYLLRNLDINKYLRWIVFALCMICPELIWVNHASITEPVMLMFFIMFFTSIMDSNDKTKYFIASFAACGVSVIHLSSYYYFPILGLIFVYETIRKDSKKPLIYGLSAGLFFFLTHVFAEVYDTVYTNLNYNSIVSGMFHGKFGFKGAFILLVAVTIVLSLFSCLFFSSKIRKVVNRILHSKIFVGIYSIAVVFLLIYSLYATFADYFDGIKTIGMTVSRSSYYGVAILTGLFVFPLTILLFVFGLKKIMHSYKHYIVALAFSYCILLTLSFFRTTVNYYYYYGRYLAPVIFLVFITFAAFLPNGKRTSIFGSVVAIIGILILSPYVLFVARTQDETHIQFNELIDFTSNFKEGDAVVFDQASSRIYMFVTKIVSGADVYPVICNSEEELEFLNENYSNVYLVLNMDTDKYEQVYSLTSETHCDYTKYRSIKILPLEEYENSDLVTGVYKFDYKYFLDSVAEEVDSNFESNEVSELIPRFVDYNYGFHPTYSNDSWISDDDSNFAIYVPASFDGNDEIDIVLGSNIWPTEFFSEYIISVDVNGEHLGEYDLMSVDGFSITLEDGLNPGEYNEITIHCSTWCPAQYGLGDTRNVGTNFKNIIYLNR